MRPNKGIAFAVAGVTVGLFGLSLSILALIIAHQPSFNIGPGALIGSLVAATGILISFLAASAIKE